MTRRSRRLSTMLGGSALALAASARAELELPRVSPRARVTQVIGFTEVAIEYSRPAVRGRTIWGELVPYGRVWRTGANEATTLSFSTDVYVEGAALKAGTYSLHTVPDRRAWTVVFNEIAEQWGSFDYDQANDAVRIEVQPRRTAEQREWLSFAFRELTVDSADVVLHWDHLQVAFTVKTDGLSQALARIDAELPSAAADDWRTPYNAAYFCYYAGVRLDQARAWAKRSAEIEPNLFTLQLVALYLARSGDHRGAVAAGERAVAANQAAAEKYDTSSLERRLAEWKKAALPVRAQRAGEAVP